LFPHEAKTFVDFCHPFAKARNFAAFIAHVDTVVPQINLGGIAVKSLLEMQVDAQ
jgi:hypothetical protein